VVRVLCPLLTRNAALAAELLHRESNSMFSIVSGFQLSPDAAPAERRKLDQSRGDSGVRSGRMRTRSRATTQNTPTVRIPVSIRE